MTRNATRKSREAQLERVLRAQRASIITAVVIGVTAGVAVAAYVLLRSGKVVTEEDSDAPLFV